jgi:hypothetical protein
MPITIIDGVGIINGEPVSMDVDYEDIDREFKTRRMRIDCHNGYKLSVVFGSCSYSDNHDHGLGGAEWHEEVETAEIAVLGTLRMSESFEIEWGDTVKGYASPKEILDVMQRVCALPPITPATESEVKEYKEQKFGQLKARFDSITAISEDFPQ